MTFKEAVEKTPGLKNAHKLGLRALRAEDRPHVVAEDTRSLTGSADIDTAFQKLDPNANRWDFAIAYQHANRTAEFIYWLELQRFSGQSRYQEGIMASELAQRYRQATWQV